MVYFITDVCIACGECAAECPVECISEGDPVWVIDADECTDCGACTEVCPSDAIMSRHFTTQQIMAQIEGVLV